MTVEISTQFWSIYQGLGFTKLLVCMLAEFRMYHSPLKAGEIFEIFAYLTGNGGRYGHGDLTVEFSTEFRSIYQLGWFRKHTWTGILGWVSGHI
jgi:hypothetical protein